MKSAYSIYITERFIYYRKSVLNLHKRMFHVRAVQICGNIRSTLYERTYMKFNFSLLILCGDFRYCFKRLFFLENMHFLNYKFELFIHCVFSYIKKARKNNYIIFHFFLWNDFFHNLRILISCILQLKGILKKRINNFI